MSLYDEVSYDQTSELTFHNVDYILHAYVQNNALLVEAEQKSNGHRWRGEFAMRCMYTHTPALLARVSIFDAYTALGANDLHLSISIPFTPKN